MYDEELETLSKELELVAGKTLAALADGHSGEYDTLKANEEDLRSRVSTREKIVKEMSDAKRTSLKETEARTMDSRLQFSRDGLAALNCAGKIIEVWQGRKAGKRIFTYEELLQKIGIVLKEKESFVLGNEYSGRLSVTATDAKTTFSYEFSNRDEYDFVLEVTDLKTMQRFMKSLTLLSCRREPEYEHGVGQAPFADTHFQYSGERIIKDLFQAFADALYKKED